MRRWVGFEDMSFSRQRLALNAVSHKMYMLKRSGVDIITITPFVASKIAARMRALERHELHCHEKNGRKYFRGVLPRQLFNNDRVRVLPDGAHWRSDKSRAAREPRWDSSHTGFSESKKSKALEALRVNPSAKTVSLSVDPCHVVDYSTGEVTGGLQVQADVYYIPL